MRPAYGSLVLALTLAACRTDTTGTALRASLQDADDPPRFSAWSAPVNVGTPVNSPFAEQSASISKDGLSLYFHCGNCPGNIGGQDVWVSHRACTDSDDPACAWHTPVNPGPQINTELNEGNPSLSPDGHRLYFNSTRPTPDGFGGNDLFVSRRRDKRDDLGWQAPENLGGGVNTTANEVGPESFEDENGTITLYFTSDRTGGVTDIYASTLQADETFGPAVLVPELSSPFRDEGSAIRRDGLEIFFGSDRSGSIPPAPGMPAQVIDLWASTRASTADPWSTPVNVGPIVNSALIDQAPALSFDGTELYFGSPFRPGNVSPQFDLWMARRTKVTGRGQEAP